jgi:hypothetical protein
MTHVNVEVGEGSDEREAGGALEPKQPSAVRRGDQDPSRDEKAMTMAKIG